MRGYIVSGGSLKGVRRERKEAVNAHKKRAPLSPNLC